MALSLKMHILGLHIIVLLNLAQSFVLLTANMEDVKKLAKKFVSESLAEQIAEFIAKISTHAVNVSEENEKNIDTYKQSSVEHSRNNIPRQEAMSYSLLKNNKIRQRGPNLEARPERSTSRQTRRTTRQTQTSRRVQSTTRYTQQNRGRPIVWSNIRNREARKPNRNKQPMQNLGKHRLSGLTSDLENEKMKNNKVLKDIFDVSNDDKEKFVSQQIASKLPPQTTKHHRDKQFYNPKSVEYGNNIVKPMKEHKKPRMKPKNAISERPTDIILDSTIGYAEKQIDENPNPNRYRFDQIPPDDINKTVDYEVIEDFKATENHTYKLPELNIGRSGFELTTEKEKNEFDQYDNKNYPKSEFVATSGPVSLPKLPPEPEWEKEKSERNKDVKKKVWF